MALGLSPHGIELVPVLSVYTAKFYIIFHLEKKDFAGGTRSVCVC